MKEAIAVTGVGAITPLGAGAAVLHDRWASGDCAIEDGVASCDFFDPAATLSRKETRVSDRFSQIAVAAAGEALEQADWASGPYQPERVACVFATGIGGLHTSEAQQQRARDRGLSRVSPLTITMQMPNAAAAMISMHFGLGGECLGVVGACASGAMAIGTACRILASGDADAVVAGGSEAAITPMSRAVFSIMGATSPTGMARPFDRRRDGFVIGEGAGALVLERLDSARQRGVPVLGEVLGYGASADAYHITAPEPEGSGAARAITRALDSAGLVARDVDYVNAHGTATQFNDFSETVALKSALGEHAYDVPISSTKSTIGHLMGAAGAVEAIATLHALRERVAPPTLGLTEPDRDLDLNYVPGHAQPLESPGQRTVGVSNSFGFGGHNAVLVLAA